MPKPSTESVCRRGIAAPRLRPLALAISVLLLGGGLGGAASAASFPATINLGSLSGSNGFRLDGVAAFDQSGRSVSAAGDINGDGLDDLIVGAVGADPNGNGYAGSSYVVYGRLVPLLALNPGTLSFADTNVGQTSAAQTLTLSNTGTADLDLGALALSGANAGEFAFSADTCSSQTLLPLSNCTVDLSFSPSAAGARSAQIDIPSNAPSSPDTVNLRGAAADAIAVPILNPWGLGLLTLLVGWIGWRRRGVAAVD